jgi:hypothetical protein
MVKARDAGGRSLALIDGPTLPDWALAAPSATAGRAFARRLADAGGREGVFYAYAVREAAADDRLCAGAIDRSRYRFAAPGAGPVEVEARVVERRRFPAQLAALGLPIEETPGDHTVVRIP